MKTYKHLVLFSLEFLLPLLLLSGCLEYTIITQVMQDGSLQRSIIIRGDSSLVYKGSIVSPGDSSWEISTRYETGDRAYSDNKPVIVYEARKIFSDVEELNRELYSDSSFVDHVNIRVGLEKRFKLFYNVYTYSETYLMFFPFRSKPVSEFMTDAELKVYHSEEDEVYYDPRLDRLVLIDGDEELPLLAKEDSIRYDELKDQLDIKFELWAKQNTYEAFYQYLSDAFATLEFIPEQDKQKEDFYNWLDSCMVFEEVFGDTDVFLVAASDYYHLDTASIRSANVAGFNEFYHKLAVVSMNLDTYTNEVLMPGLVTESNAHETDGNLVIWDFTSSDFYDSDYTMLAHSRVLNRWMVVLSGAIIALLIGLLISRLIFKKEK